MSSLVFAARAFLCSAMLAASAVAAPAQTFPSKPIRLILPYVPGGIIDNVGRNLAQRLSETMGQSVAKIGVEPRGTSTEESAAFTRAEYEKWKKVIAEGNIKSE